LRPRLGRHLSRDGLERPDALRRRRQRAAGRGAVVRGGRGGALHFWRDLPRLAAAAFPERDLARLCVGRRGVPLSRGARSRSELSTSKSGKKKRREGRRHMQVAGKVVVVTGGANGIGRALCEAFHQAGAAKVVVADMEAAGARAVAATVNGAAFKC